MAIFLWLVKEKATQVIVLNITLCSLNANISVVCTKYCLGQGTLGNVTYCLQRVQLWVPDLQSSQHCQEQYIYYIYIYTSIEAHLWQASLLQRVINGVLVKAL